MNGRSRRSVRNSPWICLSRDVDAGEFIQSTYTLLQLHSTLSLITVLIGRFDMAQPLVFEKSSKRMVAMQVEPPPSSSLTTITLRSKKAPP